MPHQTTFQAIHQELRQKHQNTQILMADQPLELRLIQEALRLIQETPHLTQEALRLIQEALHPIQEAPPHTTKEINPHHRTITAPPILKVHPKPSLVVIQN